MSPAVKTSTQNCRLCEQPLKRTFIDFGKQPLANAYLPESSENEARYPLKAQVCDQCFLVQVPAYESPENLFSDYAYFSSYSDAWLAHAKVYADTITAKLELSSASFVVEIASNDGYLLKHFVQKGIPSVGVEPAANVAKVAKEKGIPTEVAFFGTEMAQRLAAKHQANLIIANNVVAHVPNLHDFVEGIKVLLKAEGMVTLEFPHLLKLLQETQFDTIYHEHFSYFSLLTVERVLERHGLRVVDVEEIATHGGSLRIFAVHDDNPTKVQARVTALARREIEAGLLNPQTYDAFSKRAFNIRHEILKFISQAKVDRKEVVAYGAAAKGNTLLNYCGLNAQHMAYVMDRNVSKQGKFLPGSQISIASPEKVKETKPDYVVILAWNWKEEIMEQLACIREWGGRFVVFVPKVEVLP